MEMTAHEMYIRKLAFDYWNWDKEPPHEYIKEVMDYIRDHPSLFKGLTPQ